MDVSGSMQGRKLQQLQEAMNHILGELGPGDFFNILEFSYGVTITDVVLRSNSLVLKTSGDVPLMWYNPQAQQIKPVDLPEMVKAFPATPELIAKARKSVNEMTANGGTNIYDSVKAAVGVAKSAISYDGTPGKLPDPLVIFLTDGDATVGETNRDKILSLITDKTQIPMFTLAFGSDADFPFLKRLSLRTGAFARKIYEASDAALQLRDFYRQIASPLLSNVNFKYSENQIDQLSITKKNFNLLFSGTELVVCGKLLDALANLSLNGEVKGMSVTGELKFCLTESSTGSSTQASGQDRFLERLWAFLSIRQLLEKFDAERADDETLILVRDTSDVIGGCGQGSR
ncbi:hypothetical protein B566_EDAN017662 [Ephemera danica]|nr:hypothetical protein B566_EDAN017662 [Ephemera danica]